MTRRSAPHRNAPQLCFIGFGEAGQAIASGLREAGVEGMSAWDILFPEPRAAGSSAKPATGSASGLQRRRPTRCAAPTSSSRP